MSLVGDMVNGSSETFPDLHDEVQTTDRSFGLKNKVPLRRSVRSKGDFELQCLHFLSYDRTSRINGKLDTFS